jgi:hypothetical protein
MTLSMRLLLTQEDKAQPGSLTPLRYEVLGLPPGQAVWIDDSIGEGWHVLRITNGVSGEWEGHYPRAEDALAVIESGRHARQS